MKNRSTVQARQLSRKAEFIKTGENIEISEKTIGFTSAMKVGFIHQDFDKSDINYVSTEFACSKLAELNPDKSIIVGFNGVLTLVTKAEMMVNGLKEITIQLINNQWTPVL